MSLSPGRFRRRSAPPLLALAASLLVLLSSALACSPGGDEEPAEPATTATPVPEGYAEEVEAWRAERAESLRSEDGWLSLVGLHWLEEGENTFGSGEENDLVFPAGSPERIGTVKLAGGEVTLTAAEGTGLARLVPDEAPAGDGDEPEDEGSNTSADADAEPAEHEEPIPAGEPLTLAPDTSGDPTVLKLGSLTFYLIERGERYGLRVKDPEGPARKSFEGLDYYDVDPAWRVEARLERQEGATVRVPNVLGQVEDVPAPGVLVFHAPSGEELRLTPMDEGEDFFVVFGDPTNGHGTYGGGRFLYAKAPPEGEDTVLLDFNHAYNPPCAFTPYATCPLPPAENKLAVAVEAGEKSYAGEIPH